MNRKLTLSFTFNVVSDSIASLLDRLGWGVNPSRPTTLQWIEKAISNNELFHLTSLLSCDRDCISGNRQGKQNCRTRFFPPLPPSTDDVARFNRLLQNRQDFFYNFQEI